MSAEQLRGVKVDHRTDIWSLGVILYEMITGTRPFTGQYEQAVVYSILNSGFDPPTALRSGVPMNVERIAAKCLAKDPAERYQTAADLAADLGREKRNIVGGTAAAVKQGKRNLARLSWIAALLILLLAAYIILPRLLPKAEDAPVAARIDDGIRIVVLPFENLGPPEDEYFAAGITEEITSRLATIQGLAVISRKSALYYKNLDKTIEEIGRELGVDYVLEGTVRWDSRVEESQVRVTPQLIRVSDDSHVWADRYDENMEDIFDVQTRIASRVAKQLDITLSSGEQEMIESKPTENIIAYQLYLRAANHIVYGHRPEQPYLSAQLLLEQAIDIDPGFVLAWVKLSHAHRGLYFFGYDRTPERLAMAREAIDKALELDPDHPEVHRELGYFYYHGLLEYDLALEEFEKVARILPNDTRSLYDIALIWRRRGKQEEALENLMSVYRISPTDAGLCAEIANSLGGLRRADEALVFAERTILLSPENHWGYLIKAILLIIDKGDVAGARQALDDCPVQDSAVVLWGKYFIEKLDRNYSVALKHLDQVPDEVIRMQSGYLPVSQLRGIIYEQMGDRARAVESFTVALTILEKAIEENPDDPRILSSLGSAYAGLGRKEEAIAAGERAVAIYPVSKDALLGPDRMRDLAQIYSRVGEYSKAIEIIRELLSIPCGHSIAEFKLDPCFDPIREEPEYERLVQEFGGKMI
jgi:TolB-like protein/Flp pilus assembly protein TadD